jgi:valyl-tRNA synthetase
MEKTYDHTKHEDSIYKMWEDSGVFTPKIVKNAKPFTIILPLPNANDPMHMGHALFTIQDIMVRFHMLQGDPTLWLPGGDHAGIETQFVFEKKLRKLGKSRFDYDRETLYKMIWDFAVENRDLNKNQMKRLGFAMDWSRYHYSLEPEIVSTVLDTFRKLHGDGLVYRGQRLVNYCTKCGTAFSDLEINYVDSVSPLYYMKYGPFTLATTRPETKFGDTAVAVNPKDKRYKKLVGTEFTYDSLIGPKKMKVVADEHVDQDFGTGAVKVTPAHDQNDFEMAQRHNLPMVKVIDQYGKLNKNTGRFGGLRIKKARDKVVEELRKKGDLVKVDENYKNRVGHCYRCNTVIEPMLLPQWFVSTKPLAKKAIEAVKKGKTKIFPKKRFEKLYFDWMENIRDWNISRQIVWGPRIPIWYCMDCNPKITINFVDEKGNKVFGEYDELTKSHEFEEISKGLQSLSAPEDATYQMSEDTCEKCKSNNTLQETDTFDTWFLSGQWPLTTLGFNVKNPKKSHEDFKYFYPTTVMDTLWDILFFWVGRMMMFGLYLAGDVPFEVVHIHARVVDKHGKKMSKSKGNVVNPIEMVDKYGADALRMALVMGVAPASDIAISEDKIRAQRNFANKIWNIARFVEMSLVNAGVKKYKDLPSWDPNLDTLKKEDKEIVKKLDGVIEYATKGIEKYKFGLVSEKLYHFVWHEVADVYIESVKDRLRNGDKEALITLRYLLIRILQLLHPFMPFVTESIWQEFKSQRLYPDEMLIQSKWPTAK